MVNLRTILKDHSDEEKGCRRTLRTDMMAKRRRS